MAPFACTFCDWGSATKSKVRKFSEERLEREIEWFGDNEIAYVDCCDANFGIFQERDGWIGGEDAGLVTASHDRDGRRDP